MRWATRAIAGGPSRAAPMPGRPPGGAFGKAITLAAAGAASRPLNSPRVPSRNHRRRPPALRACLHRRRYCFTAFLIISMTCCMNLLSVSAIIIFWLAWLMACCIAMAWSVVW